MGHENNPVQTLALVKTHFLFFVVVATLARPTPFDYGVTYRVGIRSKFLPTYRRFQKCTGCNRGGGLKMTRTQQTDGPWHNKNSALH